MKTAVYSATWEVRGPEVVRHVAASVLPDWTGTDLVRNYAFDGDRMTLTALSRRSRPRPGLAEDLEPKPHGVSGVSGRWEPRCSPCGDHRTHGADLCGQPDQRTIRRQPPQAGAPGR